MASQEPLDDLCADAGAHIPRSPLSADLVEHLYAALERAWCKGREGPFGIYDYSDYGWPAPHRVRDFRDPQSLGWGMTVYRSDQRAEAEAEYERLARAHIIGTVIEAYEAARAAGPRVAVTRLREDQ